MQVSRKKATEESWMQMENHRQNLALADGGTAAAAVGGDG